MVINKYVYFNQQKETQFIARVSLWTEEETVRCMLLQLREGALRWIAETIKTPIEELKYEQLSEALSKRFSNQQKTAVALSKFLDSKHPNTREEFTKLLEDATTILRKEYMNIKPVTQIIIKAAPTKIKFINITSG